MSEFVKNAWYVAAWSSEVGRSLFSRVLLNEPVLLYRTEAGDLVALRDQCPHRKLPLSMGRLEGDAVECGYHGMLFGRDGRCIRIPGQQRIPAAAKVRSYPVRESMGMVWIWLGEPDIAERTALFYLPAYDDPNRTLSIGRHRIVQCHYQLLTDNLTDPAHVTFVHRSTLGSPAQAEIPVQVEEDENSVIVSRWTPNSPPAPIFQTLANMQNPVDRWQYYYLHCPSICIVDFGSAEVDAIGPDQPRDGPNAVQMYSCIFMTPQTDRTTHYFYWQSRNFAFADQSVSAAILEQLEVAFEEDFVILEAQQRSLDQFEALDNVQLALDSAPTRQRRIVARMLAAER